jgi:hypothetical protein
MDWRDLHDAPRDRPIWLFLPAAKYTARPDGSVADVQHEAVVGAWRGDQSAWMVGDRHVYPSLWNAAPIDGVMPDNPLLVNP